MISNNQVYVKQNAVHFPPKESDRSAKIEEDEERNENRKQQNLNGEKRRRKKKQQNQINAFEEIYEFVRNTQTSHNLSQRLSSLAVWNKIKMHKWASVRAWTFLGSCSFSFLPHHLFLPRQYFLCSAHSQPRRTRQNWTAIDAALKLCAHVIIICYISANMSTFFPSFLFIRLLCLRCIATNTHSLFCNLMEKFAPLISTILIY